MTIYEFILRTNRYKLFSASFLATNSNEAKKKAKESYPECKVYAMWKSTSQYSEPVADH